MKGRGFYTFAKGVMGLAMRVMYRLKVENMEHIPLDGGFVLCGNHLSSLDPILIAACVKRPMNFIGKKELFNSRFNRQLFKMLHAFPVNRGAVDMQAYRTAIRVLEAGEGLMVFSQGHRMKDFDSVKNGAAMFALKAGVPIVPVGLKSDYKLGQPVRIRFGPAIDTSAYQGRRVDTALVEEVMSQVVPAVKELTV